MGIMDEETMLGDLVQPKEHIFWGEKMKWWDVEEGDGLERHEGFNESFQKRLAEGREPCPMQDGLHVSIGAEELKLSWCNYLILW